MARIAVVFVLLAFLPGLMGCFESVLPPAPALTCGGGDDCPAGSACLLDVGRCVVADDPCVAVDAVDAAVARAVADGTACGDGQICVGAACFSARCGDGVITSPETCDGEPGCRPDCTRCGDGTLDADEVCDNGAQNSDVQPGACRLTCTLPTCGDGVRDPGEGCDEGLANSDGDRDACRTSCARASCGDGVTDDGEACDDGAANSDTLPDACRSTCAAATCGDGVVDDGEVCDTGAQNSDVRAGACRTACVAAACGDGVKDPGEGCDDGAANNDTLPGACRSTCAPATCGDGILDDGEACDDGAANSATAADACRPTCVAAFCGDDVLDGGEACDDGADNSDTTPGACREGCALPTCGDGVRDPGEACDEGTLNNDLEANACRRSCVRAACGDSVIDDGEVCDDGNVDDGDGCRGDCEKVEVCGDGVVDADEACDDGNANPRDGCDACRRQGWAPVLRVAGTSERVVQGGIGGVVGVMFDAFGRVSLLNGGVQRIELDGTISAINDGARMNGPQGFALDQFGRVLVADTGNHLIRRIEPGGGLVTIAGTGERGDGGDGGPALAATFNEPTGVAVDGEGRILIADRNNHRVRRIDLDGRITTIAGTGAQGFTGDKKSATSASLSRPSAVAVDLLGRVLIADTSNNRVRRIERDGTITTIAGSGEGSIGSQSGDDATRFTVSGPLGLAVDVVGRILIAESDNNRVLRLELDGGITTVAGTGSFGFFGDGGPAVLADLLFPVSVAVSPLGEILVADAGNGCVRRVSPEGTITSIASDTCNPFFGDGGAATSAALNIVGGIATDSSGRVFLADTNNRRIRVVDLDGTITTVAGDGSGNSPGGGFGTRFPLSAPAAVAVDDLGRVAIADVDFTLLEVDNDDRFVPIAGPSVAIAFAADGSGYFVERGSQRVLRFDANGSVTDFAGTAFVGGFDGDSGPADSAVLSEPSGVAVDPEGRVVIVDAGNRRIRRVEDGIITTIAGNGTPGPAVDGAFAATTGMEPRHIAVDPDGRILFTEQDCRIRRIEPDETISTVVGTGDCDDASDGGFAATSPMGFPAGVAVDPLGRVVFSTDFQRVRRVELDGTLSTIAGAIHPLGPGPTSRARLYPSRALVPLAANRHLSVGAQGRAVEIDLARQTVAVAVGGTSGAPGQGDVARFSPLLADSRGAVVDPRTLELFITEHASGALRVVDLDVDDDGDVDDAARWTSATVATSLAGPAGVAIAGDGSFVVVEQGNHCIRRVARTGAILGTVFGRCGTAGTFPGFLNDPTHVVVSPTTGAVYIADTGSHRVLRVLGGEAAVVIGDGSVSSAGEGEPARRFPVNAPRQLALDAAGNLYVASTTSVRLVANVDGDADADGDDRVITIFGGGDRATFPESDAACIDAVSVDRDGRVHAADACKGFMVELVPAPL